WPRIVPRPPPRTRCSGRRPERAIPDRLCARRIRTCCRCYRAGPGDNRAGHGRGGGSSGAAAIRLLPRARLVVSSDSRWSFHAGEIAMETRDIKDEWIVLEENDPPPDLSRAEAVFERERGRLVREHVG